MAKTGIYRMEIYMVDLKETYKNIIKGQHPCLIFSNWKQNVKSNYVNIIPMTSNCEKYIATQVEIKGFGLKEVSKLLPDQITSISKDNLLFKIGEVTDVNKINEIEASVMVQLQLDNKYKAININSIFEEFNNMDYEKMKKAIVKSCTDKDYNKSITYCEELLKEDTEELRWYAHYMISLNYIKLKDFNNAYTHIMNSFRYAGKLNKTHYNSNYALSVLSLASILENTGKIKESIECLKKLSKYYKNFGDSVDFKLRIATIYNITRLQESTKNMLLLIKIFEKYTESKKDIWHDDFSYKSILNNMHIDLNKVYLKQGKITNAIN